MKLNMIKSSAVASAFVALSCATLAAGGCGEDDKKSKPGTEEDAGGGNTDAGGGGDTYSASFTLVPILAVDTSTPIVTPHRFVALNSLTGEPLDPAVEAITEEGTGKVTLTGIPKDVTVAFYVEGVGPTDVTSSTYDTVLLNYNPKAGDPLMRISSVGTYKIAESTGGFTAKADRAAVSGGIYWAPGGARKGTVGCAKVCLDGAKEAPADVDQRYIASTGLPTTLDMQSQTNRAGRFYIGNITEGAHKMRISLDGCETFIGEEVEFFVPVSRGEAKSPLKAVLLQLGVDVDVKDNPTLESCPAE